MSVTWDYTSLAHAYADRPAYADAAVDAVLAVTGLSPGALVCDIGAGTGHLTEPLGRRGLVVDAVEPNAAMRGVGQDRLRDAAGTTWCEGTAEETGRLAGVYDAVLFGSSLNVTDTRRSLPEAARLLKPRRWTVCLWNHRDLDDPLQDRIERRIHARIPAYEYGSRRADQRPLLRASGLFEEPLLLEVRTLHHVDRDAWLNGWRSHATLQRQAGELFDAVVDDISEDLDGAPSTLAVPYTTRVFLARARD